MPDHKRTARLLFLGEGKELCRQRSHGVAIECHIVRSPQAVENREQKQRVFGRLTQRFRSFNVKTCLLDGCLGFACGIAFGLHQRVHAGELKLDLLATERCRTGQGCDKVEGMFELLHSFN